MVEYDRRNSRENLVPVTETGTNYAEVVYNLNNLYRAIKSESPALIVDDLRSKLEKRALSGKEVERLLADMGFIENGFATEMGESKETALQIFKRREFFGLKNLNSAG